MKLTEKEKAFAGRHSSGKARMSEVAQLHYSEAEIKVTALELAGRMPVVLDAWKNMAKIHSMHKIKEESNE